MQLRNLLRDTSVSVSSAGAAAVLSALQMIVVARILGPTQFGILQVYRLIITYSSFSNLGTLWSMVREIAYHRGRGNATRIAMIKSNTLVMNVGASAVLGMVVFGWFFFMPVADRDSMLEVAVLGAIVTAQCLYMFSRHYFTSTKQFAWRSILVILFPLANIVFVCVLGIPYGLKGVLYAMLLAYGISILYGALKKAFTIKYVLDKSVSFDLIRAGIPIFGNGLLATLLASVDRLMIIKYLPVEQLGYYGIATMVKTFLENLYRTLFMVVFPRLTEKYGETDELEAIKSYVWNPLVVSAYLSPLFFGSLIILLPVVIKYLLPKFVPGLLAAQLVIASAFFGCLHVGVINFFITIKKVHSVYPYRISALLFSVAAMWFVIYRGGGIEEIAFCVLLSSVLLSCLLVGSFLSYYHMSLRATLNCQVIVHAPFLYMVFSLWCVGIVFIPTANIIYQDVVNSVVRIVLYLFLNAPMLYLVNKRIDFFSELKMVVSDKILKRSRHPQENK